jgi:cysteine desulfurase
MGLKKVYLDNNATTRVDNSVVEYMNRFYLEDYAVASSQFSHTPGIKAKEGVEKAREIIAGKINAGNNKIVFTSGSEEANNIAIKGTALANRNSDRKGIIVSKIEHFSVLDSAKSLAKQGFNVDFIDVDNEGFVDIDNLKSLVNDKTLLVSVIHGNHEIGTVQDLYALSEVVHGAGAIFHTDASYSFLQVPVDVESAGIDLLSVSSDKVYGPKGTGALYVADGVKISKINDGGFQEFNLRGGIENVPGIAGFGKACEIYSEEDVEKTRSLRDYLYEQLKLNIDGVLLNGSSDLTRRLPNNMNVSFNYVEGESVVLHLDMRGIAVITGSACFSRALQASHVLMAMGFTHERAHGSIRFSPGKFTTKDDIDYTVGHVKEVVTKLRELSPLAVTPDKN